MPEYWIWISDNKSMDYDSVFTKLNDVGIEGAIIAPGIHPLEEIVKTAEKYGISVHLWRWILNTQNKKVIKEHPEWASVNRNGENTFQHDAYVNYYRFMCPALPEVRSFILSEIRSFLKVKGLSGISLDYCRYVDVILPEQLWDVYAIIQDKEYPEWDYGYHPYIIEKFTDQYGYNPLNLEDPSKDLSWVKYREEQVSELANMIGREVRKSGIKISASPFPTPALARKHVRQDWGSWELDMVFPMIYNGFYKDEGPNWFRACIKENILAMKPKGTMVFPGIYAAGHRERDFSLTQAMQIAKEENVDGFAIFSYNELKEEDWSEIKRFILKRP